MKKNVASQKIGAQLVSATDGSAFTGSVTVAVTLDAGTQATGSVGSGACTHEGGGYHTYAPAQAETNGDLLAFTFSGTGAVPVTIQVFTSFPQTVDNATGVADIQSRLPAALTAGGNIKAGVQGFLDSVFTEGAAGRIAAAFKQFFNIASPAATMDHGILVDTITTYTGNTPQTGDTYPKVDTEVATLVTGVADIQARLPAALTAGGFLKADVQTWLTVAPLALTSQRVNSYLGATATGVIDAAALAADAVDEIWDEVQEGTLTARHMMRIFMSGLAGILAGAATTNVTARDVANTKNRIDATVDANGNRSAVTVDGT